MTYVTAEITVEQLWQAHDFDDNMGKEIVAILLKNGHVTDEHVDAAIREYKSDAYLGHRIQDSTHDR